MLHGLHSVFEGTLTVFLQVLTWVNYFRSWQLWPLQTKGNTFHPWQAFSVGSCFFVSWIFFILWQTVPLCSLFISVACWFFGTLSCRETASGRESRFWFMTIQGYLVSASCLCCLSLYGFPCLCVVVRYLPVCTLLSEVLLSVSQWFFSRFWWARGQSSWHDLILPIRESNTEKLSNWHHVLLSLVFLFYYMRIF